MDLQSIPIGLLKPNTYNFNEMGVGQLKALADEVKRRGFIMHHITARKVGDDLVIVDGEHQWRAAQAAGLERVPVQVVEATTSEAIAETYRRNGLRGEANRVKLAYAIRQMQADAPDEQGKPLSNVKAAKALGRTEAWLRTTLQYGELADYAGRDGFPSVEAVAKLTEKDVKDWLAYARGDGPNPNGEDDLPPGDAPGAQGGQDDAGADAPEDKARKAVEGVIKKLAKMSAQDRSQVAAAIRRIDREEREQRKKGEAETQPPLD